MLKYRLCFSDILKGFPNGMQGEILRHCVSNSSLPKYAMVSVHYEKCKVSQSMFTNHGFERAFDIPLMPYSHIMINCQFHFLTPF